MKDLILVSIIINNYNYDHFLAQAIDSALAQTHPHTEVIVVDDGSTDGSRQIIEGYGDRIISVFKQNGGQASAINAGFAASKGEIICFLDSDDLFLPERINYVVKLFQSGSDIDWVFTESSPIETSEIDPQKITDIFERVRAVPNDEKLTKIDFKSEVMSGKIPTFTPSTSNLCFSRSLLNQVFPIPEIKGLSGMAITDLYIKAIAVGLGIGYSSKKNLGIYRIHKNTYSGTNIDKKRRMFGEIYTTTGYYIGKNFPSLKKISKKFLSKGFATSLSSKYTPRKSADADCGEMLKKYLAFCKASEKIEVFVFIFYYWLRLRFRELV